MQTEMISTKRLGCRPCDKSMPRTFTPLARETRAQITTEKAAHHLNGKPPTLRGMPAIKTVFDLEVAQ